MVWDFTHWSFLGSWVSGDILGICQSEQESFDCDPFSMNQRQYRQALQVSETAREHSPKKALLAATDRGSRGSDTLKSSDNSGSLPTNCCTAACAHSWAGPGPGEPHGASPPQSCGMCKTRQRAIVHYGFLPHAQVTHKHPTAAGLDKVPG